LEDQACASKVSGLGHSAKERRATQRELLIQRRMGGVQISRTTQRRLQRRGHSCFLTKTELTYPSYPHSGDGLPSSPNRKGHLKHKLKTV
jgi:hypothetical protein